MLVADYDSDEEETMAKRLEEAAAAEKAKADAALAAAASSSDDSDDSDDSSDSDSDGGGQQKAGAASGNKKASPATKLPSALDLLETVEAPAFLSVPAGNKAEFDVPPMKVAERPRDDGKRALEGGQQHQPPYKRPTASGERPPTAQHQEAPMPPPPPARRKQLQTEQEAAKRTKERLDAKERVKQQRLRGQSGIGSDFRTWKTEEEMRMRQQFD